MSNVPVVQVLPNLDQTLFPAFPQIPQGTNLLVFQTEWRSAEKESVAGALITACMSKGVWQPIDVREFFPFLEKNHLFKMMPQMIINATWALVELGDIAIIQLEGEGQYVVPTPQFAQKALGGNAQLRYSENE